MYVNSIHVTIIMALLSHPFTMQICVYSLSDFATHEWWFLLVSIVNVYTYSTCIDRSNHNPNCSILVLQLIKAGTLINSTLHTPH